MAENFPTVASPSVHKLRACLRIHMHRRTQRGSGHGKLCNIRGATFSFALCCVCRNPTHPCNQGAPHCPSQTCCRKPQRSHSKGASRLLGQGKSRDANWHAPFPSWSSSTFTSKQNVASIHENSRPDSSHPPPKSLKSHMAKGFRRCKPETLTA